MLIEMRDVHKVYRMGAMRVHALAGVDLRVEHGEYLAIMGPSGSGKSTMMNILGCLDRPTRGSYALDGEEVETLDNDRLAAIRNGKIGFVFQTFNLLPRMPSIDNVMLPLLYCTVRDRRRRAEEALARVGMEDRGHHRPTELSGGQQQRVAIARALVTEPEIVLADEPTGNLDSRTGLDIMRTFRRLNDEGVTVILVTHDEDVGATAKRVVRMRDGRIVADESAPHCMPEPPPDDQVELGPCSDDEPDGSGASAAPLRADAYIGDPGSPSTS
jgi:putative ABC transport system ATP-binding protein